LQFVDVGGTAKETQEARSLLEQAQQVVESEAVVMQA
jgi:hypothetical protein